MSTPAAAGPDGARSLLEDDSGDGFFVADDDPGILPGRQRRGLRTGLLDSTGYGLAIVAELADAHGWTVEATESEFGGARIEVRTG